MDAETRKKIEAIDEGLNREDREALNAFLTACFDLNDTLQDYQATWANYGFRTACNYFRMEVLDGMKEREAKLVDERDAYALAMKIALEDGVFPQKSVTKVKIENLLAPFATKHHAAKGEG